MKATDHKITVIMPAHNAGRFIEKAIDSVLSQTFEAFELLIINDGSSDDTRRIISSYTDSRIRLINQPHQGIPTALNMGLLNADTDFIARFDADDICFPERLEQQYNFLIAHPEYVIVGSDAEYVDANGEHVFTLSLPAHSNEEIQQLILTKCPFIHSGVLFRKEIIMKAGGYNTNAYTFQDHLLWSRIIKMGKAHNLPAVLIQVRLHPDSISIDERWRTRRFHQLKSVCIRKGDMTGQEGKELLHILNVQNTPKIKEGSYYSLLGKKYLWNNYQPEKSRACLRRAIQAHPGRLDSYLILILSFSPKIFIDWLYQNAFGKIV